MPQIKIKAALALTPLKGSIYMYILNKERSAMKKPKVTTEGMEAVTRKKDPRK